MSRSLHVSHAHFHLSNELRSLQHTLASSFLGGHCNQPKWSWVNVRIYVLGLCNPHCCCGTWKFEYLCYSCGALSISQFEVKDASHIKLRGQLIVQWHCHSDELNILFECAGGILLMKWVRWRAVRADKSSVCCPTSAAWPDGTKNSRFTYQVSYT